MRRIEVPDVNMIAIRLIAFNGLNLKPKLELNVVTQIP